MILGIGGLFNRQGHDFRPDELFGLSHDSAAALVRSGTCLAATEEERYNRDKHSLRFPVNAIQAVLDTAGASIHEVSEVAYYFEEGYVNATLAELTAMNPARQFDDARRQVIDALEDSTGRRFDPNCIQFVEHHLAHAAGAFYDSNLESALVLVTDGNGERYGTSIYRGSVSGLEPVARYGRDQSLGHFYSTITKFLGFGLFDEYKVMGLASWGRTDALRDDLAGLYCLKSEGNYSLDYKAVFQYLIDLGLRPRQEGQAVEQVHKDIAAGCQQIVETITTHILDYWIPKVGSANLCLSGGVAQNTSLNGVLLDRLDIDTIFIPAAAYDGGAPLGAAIARDVEINNIVAPTQYSTTPFSGAGLGSRPHIKQCLERWHGEISFTELNESDCIESAVSCISAGGVVGWAWGNSEFGPRALGNRSILADPGSATSRDRVNSLIKKREDFRPFAVSVLESESNRYFDFGRVRANMEFMSFVVRASSIGKELLPATTHVDGTSRVQTVRDGNGLFARLLSSLGRRTGTSAVLNTSFNNSSEPIVQSADDCISTFLSDDLDLLILDGIVVERRKERLFENNTVTIELPTVYSLAASLVDQSFVYELVPTVRPDKGVAISEAVVSVIRSGGEVVWSDLSPDLQRELLAAWRRRSLRIMPAC